MDDATLALEAVAEINFIHLPNEVNGCNQLDASGNWTPPETGVVSPHWA